MQTVGLKKEKSQLKCWELRFIRQKFLGLKPWRQHLKLSLRFFSHLFMSSSLRPHGLQQARPPCPSPTPGACSDSCPLSRWCHPTISSNPERTARSVGRSLVIWRFATKGRKSEHQRYFCELKKTRYFQLRNLVSFYTGENERVWVYGNNFFCMHLSCLGPVPCLFPSVLTLASGCWITGCSSSLPWRPRITDDCGILVYWYGRKYSISQDLL